MFNRITGYFSLFVGLCVAGYYITGVVLNWRQLKQQNEIKKTKNYE